MRLFSAENLSGYQLCSCLIMHNHLQMQFPMCMNNSGQMLLEKNNTLIEQVDSLSKTIDELNATIKELREQINKNSGNSSKPPLSDGF